MAMPDSFLPVYKEQPPQAAEYLRQAIPLMSKNKIPANPVNYAIWYEYVSGKNKRLKEEVDKLISNEQEFNDKISRELYKKFIFDDSLSALEKIYGELGGLISSAMNSVDEANQKASSAEDNFANNSYQLETAVDASDISTILGNIILETKELASTSTLLKRRLVETNEEIEGLKRELEKTRESANTDSLTGLLNRRAFDYEIGEIIKNHQNDGQLVSLLLLDLDSFKRINDDFGHLVGDKVIRFTAALLKQHAEENHLVARYGGEEMAIIMLDTSRQKAVSIAEKIRENLSRSKLQRKESGETIGQVTISIGVSQLNKNDNFDSFVNRADKALYMAKENGRNQVVDETALDKIA